jgi:hypothetical protein
MREIDCEISGESFEERMGSLSHRGCRFELCSCSISYPPGMSFPLTSCPFRLPTLPCDDISVCLSVSQAIHLMFFVHKSIRPLISDVTSAAVACGMANTLGNKGGVGISFCLGTTRIVVINSHLEAHQNKSKTRNRQFHKICSEMTQLLKKKTLTKERKEDSPSPVPVAPPSGAAPPAVPVPQVKGRGAGGGGEGDAGQDEEEGEDEGGEEKLDDEYQKKSDQLNQYGDRVIFMGDMNYRINGNRFLPSLHLAWLALTSLPPSLCSISVRRMIDQLLALKMHEVLLSNDQLKSVRLLSPPSPPSPVLTILRISINDNQIPPFFQGLSSLSSLMYSLSSSLSPHRGPGELLSNLQTRHRFQ